MIFIPWWSFETWRAISNEYLVVKHVFNYYGCSYFFNCPIVPVYHILIQFKQTQSFRKVFCVPMIVIIAKFSAASVFSAIKYRNKNIFDVELIVVCCIWFRLLYPFFVDLFGLCFANFCFSSCTSFHSDLCFFFNLSVLISFNLLACSTKNCTSDKVFSVFG